MPLSFALLVAVLVVMYLMIVLLSAHTSDVNYLLQIEVYHFSCIAQYSHSAFISILNAVSPTLLPW